MTYSIHLCIHFIVYVQGVHKKQIKSKINTNTVSSNSDIPCVWRGSSSTDSPPAGFVAVPINCF